ncbi:hypothetical protein HDU98_006075, partial [Podochytrium sp. JEL0797]
MVDHGIVRKSLTTQCLLNPEYITIHKLMEALHRYEIFYTKKDTLRRLANRSQFTGQFQLNC